MSRELAGLRLSGRYLLSELLAVGGMGEVWLAHDEQLDRTVAVKIMHVETAADPVFVRRFREEARLAARLAHPTIVTVHDVGEDDGLAYLVMELVAGRTLAAVLREEGAQPFRRVQLVCSQAAVALSVAHAAGVVHRDVKPGNILLTPEGDVKLTDFGIARAAEGSGLTRTGEVLGTPHYLSPEQIQGQRATERSDIYALGLIAHEMITGVKVFDAEGPVATALAQLNDPVPDLPGQVPSSMTELILECLAKDPTARPASAAAVADRMAAVDLSAPGNAPSLPPTSRPDPTIATPARSGLEEHVAALPPRPDPEPSGDTPMPPSLDARATVSDRRTAATAALVGILVLLCVLAIAFIGR